jgi:hypothetical protein
MNDYEEEDFDIYAMCCRDWGAGAGEGLVACSVLECREFL